MTLSELKDSIIENTLANDFLVLICEDNYFIADQYVDAICNNKNLSKNTIKSIYEPIRSANSLIFNQDYILNIIKTDTFDEYASDYFEFINTIVICKEVDKKIADLVKPYSIKIPKLVDWQLADYAKVLCPGLDDEKANFLVKAVNYDIYKLDNELSKITVFDKSQQLNILSEIAFCKDSDLNITSVVDLVKAIVAKDLLTLHRYLYFRHLCDFEPTGVITQLLNIYKALLYKRYGKGIPPEQYGLTSGRVYYIDKESPKYSEQSLLKLIKFVSEFDIKIKSGLIPLSSEEQLDYIIINVLKI